MKFIRGSAAMLLALVAGLASAQEAGSTVEKCGKSFGTLTVVDPQTGWGHLQRYGLGSPAALLRMMIQQSGCFDVVERGAGMRSLQQERALAAGGDLQAEANIGKGQMAGADFVMTPDVQIPTSDTGGIAGGLAGGLLGRLGPLAALAGGLKFKEASTSLLVADVRSSIQVAAAEGKASNTDFSIGGWAIGGGAGGALGGYTSTAEGKVVAASLLDNYNKIVLSIRDRGQLIRPTSAAGQANAAASVRAEAPQAAGQMLQAKIANVKVYAEPSRESAVVATLQRSDELVASGEVKNGFVHVDAANFSGWVQRTLVGPAAAAGGAAAPAAAPAPAALAAPLAPARPVGRFSAVPFGAFSGTFTGAESGRFQVHVSNRGVITGTVLPASGGQFGVMGALDESGSLAFQASGASGSAVFLGRYDPGTGALTGSWRFSQRDAGGTFSGRID